MTRQVRHRRRRPPVPVWVRWRCGEPDCPKRRWQFVSAVSEFDPVDAALADLEAHYARAHPDLGDDQEVVGDDRALAAA